MAKLVVEKVMCPPWQHNGNYFQAELEISISEQGRTIGIKRRCKTAPSLLELNETLFISPREEIAAAKNGAVPNFATPIEHEAIPELIKALQKAYNLKPMI